MKQVREPKDNRVIIPLAIAFVCFVMTMVSSYYETKYDRQATDHHRQATSLNIYGNTAEAAAEFTMAELDDDKSQTAKAYFNVFAHIGAYSFFIFIGCLCYMIPWSQEYTDRENAIKKAKKKEKKKCQQAEKVTYGDEVFLIIHETLQTKQ